MTDIENAAVDLRLLSFNLWRGGVQVDFSRIVEVIRTSGADIVGLQEPEGCTAALAEVLGWPFADPTRHILSRFPLFDPADQDRAYALIEVRPGRFAAVANLHLNSDPPATQAALEGAPADRIIALERERLAQVTPYVDALRRVAAEGVPVFLLGDFNAPSHLDWIPATVNARPHLKYSLDWPVSRFVADAGLRDSYREMHRDPLAKPGITWTPGCPHPRMRPAEVLDRIDFIHAAGPAEVTDSKLIGEAGGPDVDIAVMPWPTDHRAVLSTFRVRPGLRPAMIAADRKQVARGASFAVRFHAADRAAGRIAVALPSEDPVARPIMFLDVADGTDRRVVVFGAGALNAGGYQVALIDRSDKVIARTWVRVKERAESPVLRVVRTGAAIRVDWRGAPGNCFDWVALYRAGDPDLQGFVAYKYTGARIDGDAAFDLDPHLSPGDYEARLMLDDAHVVLASAPFSVGASGLSS